jgi:hypothetical protein
MHMRAMPGGRASRDTADSVAFASWLVQPPSGYQTNWQMINLDMRAIQDRSPIELMDMLADLSPEVSRALWDYLRFCNPGHTEKAFRAGSEVEDDAGNKAIKAFMATLGKRHGTPDVMIGRLLFGAFMRGALTGELVLDKRGRMPLDIATPDPASIRFRKRLDDELGEVWQAGQWQDGNFKPLDIETFCNIPIDPPFGSPYGRPMAAPALFTSIFMLGMMHDLKRVIQQQGYPRLDIAIDTEKLAAAFSMGGAGNESFEAYVQSFVDSVTTAFSSLEPDDTYVHTEQVTVNKPVGAVGNGALQGIDAVIAMLERQSVRALKTMPLMLALDDTTGETQSNRQYEVYVAGIKSIQHYAEALLERLFKLALEAQGIQCDVKFRFAELRAAEELRDAQTETMQINNAIAKEAAGWISHDEASEEITGHKAMGEKAPEATTQPQVVQDNGDGQEAQNADRLVYLAELRTARMDVEKAMSLISSNGYHETLEA